MAHHDAAAHHATADEQYLNTTEGSGHEHTDANVWMIVQFAIWLAISALVVHVLMWSRSACSIERRRRRARRSTR